MFYIKGCSAMQVSIVEKKDEELIANGVRRPFGTKTKPAFHLFSMTLTLWDVDRRGERIAGKKER